MSIIQKNLLFDLPYELINFIYEFVGPSNEYKKLIKNYEKLYYIFNHFKCKWTNIYFHFYDENNFKLVTTIYNHNKTIKKNVVSDYIKIVEKNKFIYKS